MSKFIDCFGKVSGKGYKHRDGTSVLTRGDRRTMMNDIAERVKTGEDPTQAAVAAVQRLINETDTQMESVFNQVGQPMYSTFEQVFGQEDVGDVKPIRSMAEARPVVKQTYFDGDVPVTPENTAAAMALAAEWDNPDTGPDVAQRLIDAAAASGQETPDLMFGTAQGELHTYALKLARAGDTRLLAMMDLRSNKWASVGRNETIGIGDFGARLAARASYSPNAVHAAFTEVGRARRKAETKNLPQGIIDYVGTVVSTVGLGEGPARQVKRNVKDKTGKTLEEKVEENVADKTAESLLNRFATSQSDTLSWKSKAQENEIRKLVRRALTLGPNAIAWDRVWMINSLVGLGVTPELANQLTAVVAAEKQRQRGVILARAQQRAQDTAQALAEGEVGSLRGLEDALLSVPASQQYDPTWRYNTAVEYFSQLGLTQKQAEAAARLYSNEFGARLADAQANAIERLSESRAPWAEELAKKPLEQRKKALSDLDKLRRAVRAGVTDPDTIWYNAVAEANGWRGFTTAQHVRLGEIDELLSDPAVPAYKKLAAKDEVANMVQRIGMPPSLAEKVLASYTGASLGGLPTAFVQLSAVVSIFRDFAIDYPRNPVIATRALMAAMDSFVQEGAYAARNDVYNHEINEQMRGEMPALKYMFEKGLEDIKSENPMTRWKGYANILIGAQKFIFRMMGAIDEGAIAASNIYKLTLFSTKELKRLNMTRDEVGAVVLAALDARNDRIDDALATGMDRDEATVAANETFRKFMYQGLAERDPAMAEDVLRGSINESYGMVGRRTPQGETFGVSQDKVEEFQEGLLRAPFTAVLVGINKLQSMGGYYGLAGRMLYGFIGIPFRTAMWGTNFTPYGLIRYAIHKSRTAKEKETFWKQSFGTRVQERQRLREAIAGTAMSLLFIALSKRSGEDDPDKAELATYVTGAGPTDPVVREAWTKKGWKPYTLYLKVGTVKLPLNLTRLGESVAWPLLVVGVLDDINLNQKGKAARGLRPLEYPWELAGGYLKAMSERSAFQGVSRNLGLIANAKGNERLVEDITKQAAFNASSFIPWKATVGSLSRLGSTPVDTNTFKGIVLSNTPVLGPILGKPAINVLGDPVRDNSLSGKLYREGVPLIVMFPTDGPGSRVYDLILEQGRGPSMPSVGTLERQYKIVIPPDQFYEYSKERGRIIKEEMNKRYDRLRTLDPEQFGKAMESITGAANRRAARAAGIVRSSGSR